MLMYFCHLDPKSVFLLEKNRTKSILRLNVCFLLLSSQLANTEEYVDGALSGHLGEVLIR